MRLMPIRIGDGRLSASNRKQMIPYHRRGLSLTITRSVGEAQNAGQSPWLFVLASSVKLI
jgi:hypothetical protein